MKLAKDFGYISLFRCSILLDITGNNIGFIKREISYGQNLIWKMELWLQSYRNWIKCTVGHY